ncbi:hypothetical protein E3N88_27203 [Mikania micrantha]|uniref:PB1-like domain-containing protein n=1 Tax=Mikania micrantha TaxID=192012 RepID=A0A5N6MYY5_9ASTR|nr:hypothetical protein E3N88_27203 [Mikania micrantha]
MKNTVIYYVNAKVDYVDMIDTDTFSLIELKTMLQEIGYPKEEIMFYHFLIPDMEINFGLRPICDDQDTLLLLQYVSRFKVIQVYNGEGSSTMGIGIRSLEWHDEALTDHDQFNDTQHEAEFNMVEYKDEDGGDSMKDDDRMEDDDNNVEEVDVQSARKHGITREDAQPKSNLQAD